MSSYTTSSKILTDNYCKWHANLVDLPSSQTDKIHSRLYKAYIEETGLNPWIKSETFESLQINEVSTTKKDANNYISQDCIIKISNFLEEKDVIIEAPEAGLHQYAIKHKMDPEKFSVITEAEKNRDLERDIHFYRSRIESKEDPRKYREFLTDQER
ncbi:15014_t:CDS:2 [Racocetra fulgida]|uniref:15014_t:CDS:1 n=1 Tax=Racocetra fulgida TaxID=60492 RepID=A0A9N9I1M9_9GLOM|nr:15014_t:CDS:2 [Racocetra fulgida]